MPAGAAGLGLLFMPLTLIALSKVGTDAGLASRLFNSGQVAGSSIGLAILGTIAWTVFTNTVRTSTNVARAAAAAAARAGHPLHVTAAQAKAVHASSFDHALAAGFSHGSRWRPPSRCSRQSSPRS